MLFVLCVNKIIKVIKVERMAGFLIKRLQQASLEKSGYSDIIRLSPFHAEG